MYHAPQYLQKNIFEEMQINMVHPPESSPWMGLSNDLLWVLFPNQCQWILPLQISQILQIDRPYHILDL